MWKSFASGTNAGLTTDELNGPSMARNEAWMSTSHFNHNGQFCQNAH
jgi:hypothetical protein